MIAVLTFSYGKSWLGGGSKNALLAEFNEIIYTATMYFEKSALKKKDLRILPAASNLQVQL